MTRKRLTVPILMSGIAAVVVVTLAFGIVIRAKAQSLSEVNRSRRDEKMDETALQGSWQGHPSATVCTGIFAPVPFSPTSPQCPYSFYTMTTFIPTGIAYGTPMIPGATPGHGRWSHVGYLNFLLRGQVFVTGPAGNASA